MISNTLVHAMKQRLKITGSLLLPMAVLMGAAAAAGAQAGSILPIPFVTTVAGNDTASATQVCSPDIPNNSGQNLGDGCLPTQATLVTLYDVETDLAGNIYISENGNDDDIRVIYKGGATLANMLTIANGATPNFTPIPGHIYTLAGGNPSALKHTGNTYYCGNNTNGQQVANSIGDGCPAAQTYLKPRGIAVDKYGNVYTVSNGGSVTVQVVYSGAGPVGGLISLVNGGITPQVGYVYEIAGAGTTNSTGVPAFVQLRYLAVDGNGNVFFSDGTTQSALSGATVELANNNVSEINVTTGVITTVAGESGCTTGKTTGCPYGSSGDGGPASASLLSSPYALFFDTYNNLYIADYYNAKIRVVYEGGTLPGISNPQVGDIYTYAGGGTSTANGTPANQVMFGQLYIAGIDRAGNVYAEDGVSKVIWKFDAKTGIGNIIAGGPSTGTVAAAGAFCSGSAGPVAVGKFGDGCPGPQANLSDTGTISFDTSGNAYIAESGNGIVRELSYNNQFGSSADGTAVIQPLAFEGVAAATLTGENFSLDGAATAEYADAGNDTCAASGALAAGTVCVYDVAFDPAHAGQRQGSLQLGTSSGAAVTERLSGVGVASDIAIDTGTQSTIGTGLVPNGVATDLMGNIFVSDSKGNQILKGGSSGTTLTPVITGLNNPAGVAVDGMGNIYVADAGNNRVLETSATGTTLTTLGAGLSKPQGVAVDGLGNIFVADTGNNRVLQVFANGNQQVLPLTGLAAPRQLTLDSAGDLFVLDSGNKRVVEFSAGSQSTVPIASGVTPAGVAVDPAGDIYVADSAGLQVLVYPAGSATSNTLLTGLKVPVALAADADANLFIADAQASGAIELRRSLGGIVFPITNIGQTTNQSVTVTNVGNAGLIFPASPLVTVTGSSLYAVASSTTNGCAIGTTYAAGADCNFTASFTPTVTGTTTATASFNSNAANAGTASALLSGTGLSLAPTSMTLAVTSPTGSIYYSQSVVVTATLTPSATTTAPTGTFTFTVDGKTQSPLALSGVSATLTLSLLAGAHSVSVSYSGDGTYASSAATANFTVNQAVTKTALTVAPANNNGQVGLMFTATVASTTASGETGTVNFYAGATLLKTAAVNSAGVATYLSTALTFATISFTAVYSGEPNFAGSTSVVVAPSGDFTIGAPPSSLSISQGGVGTATFAIASIFGGAGTVTPSCSGLPANSVCRFQPLSFALGATPQQVSMLIYTNVSSTLASNESQGIGTGVVMAFGLPLGFGLMLIRRRVKAGRLVLLIAGCTLTCGLLGGLTGCNSQTSAGTNAVVTPPGTSTVNVIFTGSNGLAATHTTALSLTVITDNGTF